jgi:sugar phosphate isomerase/epimerase
MTIDRRKFIRDTSLILTAGALGTGVTACSETEAPPPPTVPRRKRPDLLASYWTIAGDVNPGTGGREWSLFDFRDRVEAIAKVGFKGMGIWHSDLYHTLETRSYAEMKQILDDNGIIHVEIEFLLDWFTYGEEKKQSDIERARLLEAAEALGARHLKVGDFFNKEAEMDRIIETFADLCNDAKNAGTRILFEVMPFAMIDNVADSVTMLEGAGADNGGLMIDTWHIVKMRTPYDELAKVPKRFLLGVELNDGYIDTPEGMDMSTETTQHRKFPGEGEFDMAGFMDAIQATGYDGPYGVEVISAVNRTLPLEELVRKAYNTTMAQFA